MTIKKANNKTKKPSKKTTGSAKYDIVERFKFVMLKYRKFRFDIFNIHEFDPLVFFLKIF